MGAGSGQNRAVTISEERVDASAILGTLGPALKPQAVGRQTSAFSFACLAASAAAVCSFTFFCAALMASKQLGQTRSSNYLLHQHTRQTWPSRLLSLAGTAVALAKHTRGHKWHSALQQPRWLRALGLEIVHIQASSHLRHLAARELALPPKLGSPATPFHRGHRVVPTPQCSTRDSPSPPLHLLRPAWP